MSPKKDGVFVNLCSGRKSNKYVVVVSLVQPFLVPSSPGSEEQLSKLVHPLLTSYNLFVILTRSNICNILMIQGQNSIQYTRYKGKLCILLFLLLCSFSSVCHQKLPGNNGGNNGEIRYCKIRNQIFHLKSLSQKQPSYTIA